MYIIIILNKLGGYELQSQRMYQTLCEAVKARDGMDDVLRPMIAQLKQ